MAESNNQTFRDKPATFPAQRNKYTWMLALAVQWRRRYAGTQAVRMVWQAANEPVYSVLACVETGHLELIAAGEPV